ncbi:unnamed protein product [Clonostachys rosea]|uniref:Uncharacterized protein n=1 Tax=Bionectria ochroleuca TaxID=29856 RepID=A0ABY6U917_BIOOC|nr:unnamed protein product [Clonostachys rosea]
MFIASIRCVAGSASSYCAPFSNISGRLPHATNVTSLHQHLGGAHLLTQRQRSGDHPGVAAVRKLLALGSIHPFNLLAMCYQNPGTIPAAAPPSATFALVFAVSLLQQAPDARTMAPSYLHDVTVSARQEGCNV